MLYLPEFLKTILMKITISKEHHKPLIAALVFLLAYIPAILSMWDRWFARDSYYSHGILIPFVSVYLIWQKREELAKTARECSRWGALFIGVGLLGYLTSAVFRVNFTASFSMLFVIYGLILHFYGARILRIIIFPVSFFFFMLPLPSVLIVKISFKMKLFAATIAGKVLNSMGLMARQQGSIIIMQNAQIIVDDVCSGLRSLISLSALGSLFAYWLKGPAWKRILLFATTIPIAIITNVCRVVLLSSISEIWGSKYATGTLHDVTGFLVFVLAFVMLSAIGRLME